jgi:tetratricopeptide (TPR) repeat protein
MRIFFILGVFLTIVNASDLDYAGFEEYVLKSMNDSEMVVVAAERYIDTQPEKALKWIRVGLEKFPRSAALQALGEKASLRIRQFDRLERLGFADPHDSAGRMIQLEKLEKAKAYAAIAEAYEILVQMTVLGKEESKIVTRVYWHLGDVKKADAVVAAMALKEQDPIFRLQQAKKCRAEGDFDGSAWWYKKLYRQTGQTRYAFARINALLRAGREWDALAQLQELRNRYPDNRLIPKYERAIRQWRIDHVTQRYQKNGNSATLLALMEVLAAYDETKKAMTLAQKHLKRYPDAAPVRTRLGEILAWRESDPAAARRVLSSGALDPRGHLLLGQLLLDADAYDHGMQELARAMDAPQGDPTRTEAARTAGLYRYWNGDYEGAKPLLQEAEERVSKPDSKQALAVVSGRWGEAAVLAETRFAENPNDLDMLRDAAYFRRREGAHDKAMALYRKLIKLSPETDAPLREVGDYFLEQGNKEGFALWERSLKRDDSAESRYRYALRRYWYDTPQSALEQTNQALVRDASHREAGKLKRELAALGPSPAATDAPKRTKNRYEGGIDGFWTDDTFAMQYSRLGVTVRSSGKNEVEGGVFTWNLEEGGSSRSGTDAFLGIRRWALPLVAGVHAYHVNEERLYPYMRYTHTFASRYATTWTVGREPLFMSKYAVCPYDRDIYKDAMEVTLYAAFPNGRDIWGSVEIEEVSDGNRIVTPQFSWSFFHRPHGSRWSSDLYLSGWYQRATETTGCYYSPERADTTALGYRLSRHFADTWKATVYGSAGWTMEEEQSIREYGLEIRSSGDEANVALSCKRSEYARSVTQRGDGYWYRECQIKAGVWW